MIGINARQPYVPSQLIIKTDSVIPPVVPPIQNNIPDTQAGLPVNIAYNPQALGNLFSTLGTIVAPPPPPPVPIIPKLDSPPSTTSNFQTILWIIVIVVVIALGITIWVLVTKKENLPGNFNETGSIIHDTVSGSTTLNPISGRNLPRSINQDTGLEMTFAWWMVIDDWSYKMGERKNIFIKGDKKKGEEAPGIYLSPVENTMEIVFDTFKKQDETIKIKNLTAKKWMHFTVIVSNENIVTVYVNGQLKVTHRMSSIIKQNDGDLTIADNGGFSGELSQLKYFNYALDSNSIQSLVSIQLQEDIQQSCLLPSHLL